MIATTTHDTKRSEDVRARISLLAEIPSRWAEAVERWAAHNEPYKTGGFPDRNIEYLLYQTLVGAWPIDTARTWEYVQKAAREAKAYTSWTDPDPDYEEALRSFVVAILADPKFVDDLNGFVTPLIAPGRINSLAQVLIKLTAPGVPDIYQGNELWDLSLVDPDNRRAVDYAIRRRLLEALQTATAEEIMARSDEGLPKLWVTKQALALRKRAPALFGPEGDYRPIRAEGPRADHVVAFGRGDDCVVVTPRLPLRLDGRWEETALPLPAGEWYNDLTGDVVPGGLTPLKTLLKRFPVALLSRTER